MKKFYYLMALLLLSRSYCFAGNDSPQKIATEEIQDPDVIVRQLMFGTTQFSNSKCLHDILKDTVHLARVSAGYSITKIAVQTHKAAGYVSVVFTYSHPAKVNPIAKPQTYFTCSLNPKDGADEDSTSDSGNSETVKE